MSQSLEQVPLWHRAALRPGEAAAMLGMSEKAFRRLRPEIPCVRRGRVVLFRREALETWLVDNEVSETDQVDAIAREIGSSLAE